MPRGAAHWLKVSHMKVTAVQGSVRHFADAVAELREEGLDWLAYARSDAGPDEVSVLPHQGVLLFLARGATFGARTPYQFGAVNPFDERASSLVVPFVERHLRAHDHAAKLLYPAGTRVNLLAWLAAARAQYPSRLGIGIRPDCGTWFAVRAAVAVALPTTFEAWLEGQYPALDQTSGSPCATCADQPCRSACPGAVGETFDLMACVEQRLAYESPCESRCAARTACPIGVGFQYPVAQLAYHYSVSLAMLRRWKDDNR